MFASLVFGRQMSLFKWPTWHGHPDQKHYDMPFTNSNDANSVGSKNSCCCGHGCLECTVNSLIPETRAKVYYNHQPYDSGCVNGPQVVLELNMPQARLNPRLKEDPRTYVYEVIIGIFPDKYYRYYGFPSAFLGVPEWYTSLYCQKNIFSKQQIVHTDTRHHGRSSKTIQNQNEHRNFARTAFFECIDRSLVVKHWKLSHFILWSLPTTIDRKNRQILLNPAIPLFIWTEKTLNRPPSAFSFTRIPLFLHNIQNDHKCPI